MSLRPQEPRERGSAAQAVAALSGNGCLGACQPSFGRAPERRQHGVERSCGFTRTFFGPGFLPARVGRHLYVAMTHSFLARLSARRACISRKGACTLIWLPRPLAMQLKNAGTRLASLPAFAFQGRCCASALLSVKTWWADMSERQT